MKLKCLISTPVGCYVGYSYTLVLSLVLMFLPSCREKKPATGKFPTGSSTPATRSHDRSIETNSGFIDTTEESSDPYAPVNLIKLTDSGIFDLCVTLIKDGNPTPETENADRLENCLFQLALRNTATLYQVISLLPPGRHSESFVSSTFMRHKFASFADALAMAEPIKESDLYRAALKGALSNYQMSSGEMSLGLDIPRLRGLKDNGLNDEQFSKLVISGVAKGDFDLPVALAELNLDSSRGNSVMMEIIRVLPSEMVKTVFDEARSRGSALDLGSVSTFARSYANHDSEAAIAWAAELPEKESLSATRSIFYEWTDADPMKASARIRALEPGPLKDAAIVGMIQNTVANGAVDEAENWAAVIQDQATKNKMNEFIAKSRSSRQIRH